MLQHIRIHFLFLGSGINNHKLYKSTYNDTQTSAILHDFSCDIYCQIVLNYVSLMTDIKLKL